MDRVKNKRRHGYTRVSPKHQVTFPIDALAATGIAAGDELRVEADRPGRLVLVRTEDVIARFAGALTEDYPPGYLDDRRDEWER